MKKNKLIRFVQSAMLLPVLATSFSQSALTQKFNIGADGRIVFNQTARSEAEAQAKALKEKAGAIDAYFSKYDMPLEGTGMKMVTEAEKNDLDWRLLAAIAVRESTGGKHACKNNPFGWGSCKISFKSYDEAIEIVAKNLGGNNPKTAYHYENKTTREILNTYNPPAIVARYTDQVINIMNKIGVPDTAEATPVSKVANS